MKDYTSEKNRRKFKRVKADILCRSAPFSLSRKPIQDIGIGGLRVYSDEKQKIGILRDIGKVPEPPPEPEPEPPSEPREPEGLAR